MERLLVKRAPSNLTEVLYALVRSWEETLNFLMYNYCFCSLTFLPSPHPPPHPTPSPHQVSDSGASLGLSHEATSDH